MPRSTAARNSSRAPSQWKVFTVTRGPTKCWRARRDWVASRSADGKQSRHFVPRSTTTIAYLSPPRASLLSPAEKRWSAVIESPNFTGASGPVGLCRRLACFFTIFARWHDAQWEFLGR